MHVDTLNPDQPNNRLFSMTVGFSLLAHVVVIGLVHFTPPDPRTLFNRAPLEIVLVNARSKNAPAKADVLAQANLDGGGNTDEANRRIKTPLPAQQVLQPSNELVHATRQQQEQEERLRKLLAQAQMAHSLSAEAVLRPSPVPSTSKQETEALNKQASEIARREGEIAREIAAYQSRPRMAYVAGRSKAVAEARYVDDWRTVVERVGNENFPTSAGGKRLYGRLLVTVEINRDGSLRNVTFDNCRTCNNDPALQKAAARILARSAPFPGLPRGILDRQGAPADILSITRSWTFSRGDNAMTAEEPAGG
ncbi:hypothetical protein [Chitinimonas sp. JJ19]|uniref:hypothetical protein n=1 Tax=Chitinimonas sp. JJ19 TaxID=3109352 RepID=UPI0030028454